MLRVCVWGGEYTGGHSVGSADATPLMHVDLRQCAAMLCACVCACVCMYVCVYVYVWAMRGHCVCW